MGLGKMKDDFISKKFKKEERFIENKTRTLSVTDAQSDQNCRKASRKKIVVTKFVFVNKAESRILLLEHR